MIVHTLLEVSKHFGSPVETIRSWRRSGMPGEKGRWDIAEIEEWRATRNLSQSQTGTDPDLSHRLLEAKISKTESDARLQKRKADLEEGRWVEQDKVEQFVSAMNQYCSHNLLRIPQEMASSFPRKQRAMIVNAMSEQLELFLKGLANWQQRVTEL